MANDITILIKAKATGQREVDTLVKTINTGFGRGKVAMEAFNAAAGNGRRIVANLGASVRDLVGAYIGLEAAKNAFIGMIDILKRAEQAQFDMATSVAAANREFQNTGSLDYWKGAVQDLSGYLGVYSDIAIKNAISRTVDMTKRLGLSADQMQEVIKRTGDLSAGKVDLEAGIERVTSALRGEAEAAEYLGLTLNENYVKAWYEARGATQGAWKDLDDLQKAQVRYQVFLEQTAEMQGRAAESAKTFGGALQLIQKEIENAVTNNKDLAESMSQVADFIRENADEIGELASQLIELTAAVVQFALEWKEVLAVLAGIWGVTKAIGFLSTVVRGLGAAMDTLKAARTAAAISSIGSAASEAMVLGVPFSTWLGGALVLAAGWATQKFIDLGIAIWEFRKAEDAAREASRQRIQVEDKANKKAVELGEQLGINISSMEEFNRLVDEGKIVWDDTTRSWRKAESALRDQQRVVSLTKEQFDALKKSVEDAGKAYEAARRRVASYFDFAAEKASILAEDERQATLTVLEIHRQKTETLLQMARQEADQRRMMIIGTGADAQQEAELEKQIAEDLKNAKIRAIEDWESKLKDALKTALGEEKKYAEEVKRLQEQLRQAQQTTEEKIRDLRRKTMSESEAWYDRQKEAQETLRKAQEALWSGTEEGAKRAQELAKKAQDQFAGLAGEVKEGDKVVISEAETVKAAIAGVEEAGRLVNQSIERQIELAQQNKENWATTASEIQTQLDGISKKIEEINKTPIEPTATIQVDSREVDAKLAQLDGLVTHSTHVIHVREVREKRWGGLMASGGKLPGYGGGDRIRALLEAGEYVVRKEAVAKYGSALFDALNNMRLDVPALFAGMLAPIRKFADGGLVSSGETFTIRLQAGGAELPITAVGNPMSTREAVKAFEAELSKLRLTRS